MGWNVTVDTDKCTGCGECVDVCPVEVYELPAWKFAKTAPSPLKKTKNLMAAA